MKLELKPFTTDDVDFAVRQASREGWATGPSFFRLHLKHDPAGAWIAWLDDRRVGLVTAAGYEATGWIGNLIVEQEYRRRGIGRRLMQRAIGYLEAAGLASLCLDADPPGVPLYHSLGFEESFQSLRFRLKGGAGELDERIVPLTEADLFEILRLDRDAFGDRRERLLPILLDSTDAAVGIREGGRLAGFVASIESTTGIRIGPLAAESVKIARALIETILFSHPDKQHSLGLIEHNRPAVEMLEAFGFEASPPCLRMVRGEQPETGDALKYFAIAGGDIG
jgi:ribosomal protein S18 acetylase RimI-like enzyme